MQVTLKAKTPLSKYVLIYNQKFGHLPSIEAMKHLTPENLDSIAKKAVDIGEPIPEWRDRATTKTGTMLDELYE